MTSKHILAGIVIGIGAAFTVATAPVLDAPTAPPVPPTLAQFQANPDVYQMCDGTTAVYVTGRGVNPIGYVFPNSPICR